MLLIRISKQSITLQYIHIITNQIHMTQLRFIQLYDYVIGCLYSLKRVNKTGFFSLRKILREALEYPATADDIFLIGKYLELGAKNRCSSSV